MYTFELRIDKLERGTKTNSKGDPMPGLYVEGEQTKPDGSVEPWKKFLMDWNAASGIAVIEQSGVGSSVSIGMEKEGKFWNIKTVTPMGAAPAAPPAATPSPAPAAVATPAPTATQVATGVPTPVPVLSQDMDQLFVVSTAVKLVEAMLAAGLIKGAKATADVVVEGTLRIADKLAEYMKGEIDSEPESDTSDLKEPDIPDKDIPF